MAWQCSFLPHDGSCQDFSIALDREVVLSFCVSRSVSSFLTLYPPVTSSTPIMSLRHYTCPQCKYQFSGNALVTVTCPSCCYSVPQQQQPLPQVSAWNDSNSMAGVMPSQKVQQTFTGPGLGQQQQSHNASGVWPQQTPYTASGSGFTPAMQPQSQSNNSGFQNSAQSSMNGFPVLGPQAQSIPFQQQSNGVWYQPPSSIQPGHNAVAPPAYNTATFSVPPQISQLSGSSHVWSQTYAQNNVPLPMPAQNQYYAQPGVTGPQYPQSTGTLVPASAQSQHGTAGPQHFQQHTAPQASQTQSAGPQHFQQHEAPAQYGFAGSQQVPQQQQQQPFSFPDATFSQPGQHVYANPPYCSGAGGPHQLQQPYVGPAPAGPQQQQPQQQPLYTGTAGAQQPFPMPLHSSGIAGSQQSQSIPPQYPGSSGHQQPHPANTQIYGNAGPQQPYLVTTIYPGDAGHQQSQRVFQNQQPATVPQGGLHIHIDDSSRPPPSGENQGFCQPQQSNERQQSRFPVLEAIRTGTRSDPSFKGVGMFDPSRNARSTPETHRVGRDTNEDLGQYEEMEGRYADVRMDSGMGVPVNEHPCYNEELNQIIDAEFEVENEGEGEGHNIVGGFRQTDEEIAVGIERTKEKPASADFGPSGVSKYPKQRQVNKKGKRKR